MATAVLSDRALNRATLARQLLLRAVAAGARSTRSRHLVGLQAQNPLDPYLALWSRLARFDPDGRRPAARATGRWCASS